MPSEHVYGLRSQNDVIMLGDGDVRRQGFWDQERASLRESLANLEGANLIRTKMNGATLCNTTMPDGSVLYSGC